MVPPACPSCLRSAEPFFALIPSPLANRAIEQHGCRVGMKHALKGGMKARKLEDLLVYQKALEGIDAVAPILRELLRCRDFELHKQLSESSGRILGHIGEGFGQGTDRQFAKYLCIARGSSQETRGHIAAAARKYPSIPAEVAIHASGVYQDLIDMLTAFIEHLRRCDFRWR